MAVAWIPAKSGVTAASKVKGSEALLQAIVAHRPIDYRYDDYDDILDFTI